MVNRTAVQNSSMLSTDIQITCYAECSNNAQVPYEGDRVIRASHAYTCSWILTVPQNYTVRLTITQKNVHSVGNTNCANDHIQVSNVVCKIKFDMKR